MQSKTKTMNHHLNNKRLKSFLFGRGFVNWTGFVRNYRDRDKGRAFTVGIRFNQELDFLEILSFWAEGVGAAIYLAAILSNNFLLATSGLLFIVIAVVALLAHLGKVGRAWRVPANLATAWVSRGAFIIAGFVGSGVIYLYLTFFDVQGPYRALAFLVSCACAVLLMFYAGCLLRSLKAIKLWNGPWMPLTFVAHSAVSGLVILACLNWTVSDGSGYKPLLAQIASGSLLACLFLTVLHLRRTGNSAAVYASLSRLAGGDLKIVFLGATLFLGIALPFFFITSCAWWRGAVTNEFASTLATVTIASRLVGDLAYRYAVVRAGAYEPIL